MAMAAAIVRGVGSRLEEALSSGRSLRLQQLVEVCSHLDRLIDLHNQADFTASMITPELVHETQIVYNVGTLLGLVLEQYSNLGTGWDDLVYCRRVQKAAAAMATVLPMALGSGGTPSSKEDPVFARQLAASSLLPGLAAALPGLAEAVEAATEPRPCIEAALGGVLGIVCGIFGVWPGRLGVLRSKAAGPLVQPTLRLLVALFQYAVATNDAACFEVIVTNSVEGMATLADQLLGQTDRAIDVQQHRRELQDHPYLKDLLTSPAFLTLLLTVTCVILHSGSPATAAAHVAHLGAATAAAVADITAPVDPKLQMKVTQILQDLYGQSDTASSWQLLLSGSWVVTRTGWMGIIIHRSVLYGAAECVQQINEELQHAAAAVEVQNSSEPHQPQLSLPPPQLLGLHALRRLPMLLLGALCSKTAQAATKAGSVYRTHRAAISLVKAVITGWGLQLELQSSSVGIQMEQLPCAELLKVLLQQFDVLQQMKSEVAAALATAQSAADDAGSSLQTSADASSAVAVEAGSVKTLDIAMVELLEVLTLLQTVSQYAVWQPHVHEVADAVEHCLRSSSSGSDAAATLYAHHSLGTVCDCFLWHGAKTCSLAFRWADSERQFVVKDSGPLLRAAAAAGPGSQEQQQVFTILISLLKSSSSFQRSGLAEYVLETSQQAVGRTTIQVATHMLDTLCIDSNSRPSALAALPHGMSDRKLLCAAAPWLVASSRLVLHTATQLTESLEALEDQLRSTPADGPSSGSGRRDVGAQTGPGSDAAEHIKGDHLLRVLHCNECVLSSGVRWFALLENCSRLLQTSSAAGGGGSTDSGRDIDAVRDSNTSVTAASASAAGTGLAAVLDALQDLQQAELQKACHALDSELLSSDGLEKLLEVCSAASADWQQEMEAGQQLCWSVFASAATSAGTGRAVLALDLQRVLQSYNIKLTLQELCNVGQRVCAEFPLKYCCNNPM